MFCPLSGQGVQKPVCGQLCKNCFKIGLCIFGLFSWQSTRIRKASRFLDESCFAGCLTISDEISCRLISMTLFLYLIANFSTVFFSMPLFYRCFDRI